jgi:hypothetical protein
LRSDVSPSGIKTASDGVDATLCRTEERDFPVESTCFNRLQCLVLITVQECEGRVDGWREDRQ